MSARLEHEIFNMRENDSKVFTVVVTNRQDGNQISRKRRWIGPWKKMKRGRTWPCCFVDEIVGESQIMVDAVQESDSQQYEPSSYNKYCIKGSPAKRFPT